MRLALIFVLVGCGPRLGKNPFEFEPTPIEGPVRTVCEMAKASEVVIVGRTWVRDFDLVSFSGGVQLPMTRFDLHTEELISGSVAPPPVTVHVRGGLRYGSNVGNVNVVLDGGRGVWFCDSREGVLVAIERGLMSETTPDVYHGERYVDAGISLQDIRTMTKWETCGSRAYP